MPLPDRLAAVLSEPPKAFSPVPIWWWSGEKLDPARLRWQLERFVEGGVYQLVVLNLAPAGSDHGCDADDPPFLSEAWWEIFLGVCADAEELGVSLWFYDQLGFSGADLQARLVAGRPSYAGRRLHRATITGTGRLVLQCPSGGRPIAAVLEPLDGGPSQAVTAADGEVECQAPMESRLSLFYETDHGFDYLSGEACAALLDQVHGEFARRLGPLLGTVVVGSFQDELPSMPTWSATFADEFVARYAYDVRDRLAALWGSDLPDADRVRRDYHALRAALAEEAFFKPLFDWHEKYGLTVGCDQQDPARAGLPVEGVQLYADYARTHRWFSAPGSDHHGDARFHSSLAHLYDRPRTWIEAFHSTGWGGTLEETFDWLLPWLRTGATLYNPHAVYYTTRAGWWEWAPPSTDWRQPYWRHHKHFADAVARLCAALSMGRHVCDVAVLFPNATAQAGLTMDGPGADAVRAQEVYRELIGDATWFAPKLGVLDRARLDADVIDDDSLATAEVGADGRLYVADEQYAAVVLPAATVLEAAVAERLDEFVAAGGLLVAVGALPERAVAGSDKAVVLLRERFDLGEARLVDTADEVPDALARLSRRVEAEVPTLVREVDDALVVFITATEWSATRVGDGRAVERGISHDWATVGYDFDSDRYLRETTLRVRNAPGAPLLCSPFGAEPEALPFQVVGEFTEVTVPFNAGPAALVVFAAGNQAVAPTPEVDWSEQHLTGDWDVTLIPTLDNSWGDFAWPAAPQSEETVVERWGLLHRVDDQWQPTHATFGPHGLIDGVPVEYSDRLGIHKDRIHKDSLGPKGHVPEEFLDFGVVEAGRTVSFSASFTLQDELTTTVVVGAPAAKELLIDGLPVEIDDAGGHFATAAARLSAGRHAVELRLTPDAELPLRANLAFVRDLAAYRRPEWIALAEQPPAGTAIRLSTTVVPAGETELTLTASGSARVLVNGVEVGRQGGFLPYERPTPRVRRYDVSAALRPGENEVAIELSQSTPILVDGLVVSDHDWTGQLVGTAGDCKVVRRRRRHRALADLYLHRRPHPLPAAAWLDGTDTSVVEPITFAVPRADPHRTEYLRFDLPPGTLRLELDLNCHAVLAVDGHELTAGTGHLVTKVPAGARTGQLTLRTEPGFEAGAALAGPIRAIVGPGRMALGDWEDHGLAEYSGGVCYRRKITATGAVQLDLGRVRGTAEVLVDGRSAGVRFCAPYVFELTGLTGEHTLDIEVFGTAAPYLDAVSPTHFVFGGQRTSGLFGPVQLRHPKER
jgi:hypothetical protein